MSEAAIRTPQKGTIEVDRTFKVVFDSNMTGTIGMQLLKMWFLGL
jgi:preprotein translocase subunit SecD